MRQLHRLIAAIAVAVLPLAVGGAVMLAATGEIDAARREVQGVRYAGLVLPELVGLARDGVPPPADPALVAAAADSDAAFGTTAIARAYDQLKAQLASGAHPAAARHAAAMLVARIHEASGIAAEVSREAADFTRVPAAANAAPLPPALMQAARHAVTVLPAEKARLEQVLAQFRTATAEAGATPAGRAYVEAASALADRVASGIAAIPDGRAAYDWAGLDAAHDAFQDAALTLGQASGSAMTATLNTRIADAEFRLAAAAELALLLALVSGAVTFLLAGRKGQLAIKEAPLSSRSGKSGAAGPGSHGALGARMAKTSSRAKGGLKLTTAISAMVFTAVTVAIAAVLFSVWFLLAANSRATADQRLATDLRIAAAILEVSLPNSDIFWSEGGELEKIEAKAMPKFRTHDLIDTIGRVTGDTATLFVFDPETQDFVGKTTTILDDKGERILETPLAKDDPAYPVVSAGSTYSGEATILGVPYYTIYAPIQNLTNEVIGLVYVGIPKAEIDAAAVDGLKMLGLVGGIAVLVIGALSVFTASRLTRPIPRLSKAMGLVAAGDLDCPIPYTSHGNEIGDMARNVEVFRANALKVQELTEDERLALEQRRAERAEMMMTLQQSFGDVVEAATEGDFSRRVDAHFADDELNRLAHSVNRLVGTVEAIFADAGMALSAIADADLTQRMSGEYGGALGKLRDDTNNVTERLAHMVTTLKQTSGALKTATSEILSGANDLSERTRLVAEAVLKLDSMLEAARRSNTLMAAIAAESREQAGAIDEVNGAVRQLDQMTQHNAALVEEMNAAIEQTEAQAGEVDAIADVFTLDRTGAARQAA